MGTNHVAFRELQVDQRTAKGLVKALPRSISRLNQAPSQESESSSLVYVESEYRTTLLAT